jgi:hypothetical protein
LHLLLLLLQQDLLLQVVHCLLWQVQLLLLLVMWEAVLAMAAAGGLLLCPRPEVWAEPALPTSLQASSELITKQENKSGLENLVSSRPRKA